MSVDAPYVTRHLDGDKRFLILCNHASNFVPPALDGLGLASAELDRHIAYDPGALEVAEKISDTLNCPMVAAHFSRLLIDPNRGLDDPTLVMKISDGVVIPANAQLDPFGDKSGWQARIDTFYTPHDEAIIGAIAAARDAQIAPIILSVHSFTPCWRGVQRPWQAAVLWDKDDRLKCVMADYMAQFQDICFGDNQPYSGQLKNDCLYRHGTQNGLSHALIELRQDEIDSPQGQAKWAAHMVAILTKAASLPELRKVSYFGSVNDGIN